MNCAKLQHHSPVIGVMSVLVIALSSCSNQSSDIQDIDRKDVWVSVDWSGFEQDKQQTPTGMSLYFYPTEDKPEAAPLRFLTNYISGTMVNLPLGRYDVLVFNQSVEEFGSMHFTGMDKFETAAAVLEEFETTWNVEADGQMVAYEPEWLAVDTYQNFDPEQSETLNLKPRNIIYTAKASIAIEGVDRARSIRGSITGMAGTCFLSSGIRTGDSVTHVLNSWSATHSEDNYTFGTVFSTFRTFSYPTATEAPSAEDFVLYTSFKLRDESVSNYKIPVGKIIENNDSTMTVSIDVVRSGGRSPIILPEVDAGDDPFRVSIDPWEEQRTIDVQL